MTSPACPFCGFDQPEVTVFADDNVQAFMSLSPINRYHVLVVPRVHYERLADLPHEILISAMHVVQRVSVAVRTVAKPDAISHFSDDDLTGSGFNLVAHWKMHVIPRYRNDAVVIAWNREPDPGLKVRARFGREVRQALLGAESGNAVSNGVSLTDAFRSPPMRFDIYGRYEIEVARDGGTWKVFSVGEGKRVPRNDIFIPPDVREEDLKPYLDDLLHEQATPGRTIRRVAAR